MYNCNNSRYWNHSFFSPTKRRVGFRFANQFNHPITLLLWFENTQCLVFSVHSVIRNMVGFPVVRSGYRVTTTLCIKIFNLYLALNLTRKSTRGPFHMQQLHCFTFRGTGILLLAFHITFYTLSTKQLIYLQHFNKMRRVVSSETLSPISRNTRGMHLPGLYTIYFRLCGRIEFKITASIFT